ncbi:hypothetical protein AB1Y20_006153 [Prymnesium parvum]|uniref:Sulfotransferase n=1 Tax=Prymnesium parvum TaxID=97485 RepID=A0AB34J3D3_PRYPA
MRCAVVALLACALASLLLVIGLWPVLTLSLSPPLVPTELPPPHRDSPPCLDAECVHPSLPLPSPPHGEASAHLAHHEWGLHRIRAGQPIRIVAAGLSRSSSTWQFIALTLLLEAAVELHSPLLPQERMVHNAYFVRSSARQERMYECLAHRYCVVKSHELIPDVLERSDAIFLSHRDVRDVLESSARFFTSCLYYGVQPVASAFAHYAAWLPHACYDMQHEAKATEGDALTLRRHAAQLGIPCSATLAEELAHRIALITGGAADEGNATKSATVQQQRDAARDFALATAKTGGQLHGRPSHRTSSANNPDRKAIIGRVSAARRHCNRSQELALIEEGWGGWLIQKGYARADELVNGSSNIFVESLVSKNELMGGRDIGWAAGCPRTTRWNERLAATGVWEYSRERYNATFESLVESLEASALEPAGLDPVDVLNAIWLALTAVKMTLYYVVMRLGLTLERLLIASLALGAMFLVVVLHHNQQADALEAKRRRELTHKRV